MPPAMGRAASGFGATLDPGHGHHYPRYCPTPIVMVHYLPQSHQQTTCEHGQSPRQPHQLGPRTGGQGLLHLDAAAQNFDVRNQTLLSKTDNMATLYWQRKGT